MRSLILIISTPLLRGPRRVRLGVHPAPDIVLQRFERGIYPFGIDAATPPYRTASTPHSARDLSESLDQVVGGQPRRQRVGDLYGEILAADHDGDAVAVGLGQRVI